MVVRAVHRYLKNMVFEQFEVFKSFNCDEIEVEVESLNINGLKYF